MRRMPNDTIIVSVGTQQFVTELGDPGLPNNGRGGSDKMIATVDGSNAVLTFVGDDQSLQGHSHGGNDHLAATVTGFGDYVFVDGDAQAMSGHARGGNDVFYVDASTSIYATLGVFGDAETAMSADTSGGNDLVIASTGNRSSGAFSGDSGSSMSDHAQGGNDILSVTQVGIYGGASISGDALVSMSGDARGGNDVLIYTVGAAAQSGGASLVGDAGYMSEDTRGGNDILIAAVNGNPDSTSIVLVGDASNMSGNAHGGDDILLGSNRDDWLYGDAQTYAPFTAGSITGGKDMLNGGGGNDQLWGGPNDDRFVFNQGSGLDVINDFDEGNKAVGSTAREHDLINLHDYGFADWAALKGLISDDSTGNAVIHLTATDTITLEGVHTADLHAKDFIV